MTKKQELKEVLQKGGVTSDPFANGDVIQWTTADGSYTYVAIKTPVGWYTSATAENMYVRPVYRRYVDLVKMLSKKDVGNIRIAAEWDDVR